MSAKPTVYAVHWTEINVFKIGFSENNRWRSFVNLGANVLGLMEFESVSEGYDFEDACHIALRAVCRPGFDDSSEAICYLGGRGGGYVECYRTPGDLMPMEILDFVDSQLAVLNERA